MCDNFNKNETVSFTLEELKKKPQNASTFFNFLTNLEKLLQYERKDPFSAAGERNDYPDFSDWDKFAMYEYKRLSSEEDEENNVSFYTSYNIRMNSSKAMTFLIQKATVKLPQILELVTKERLEQEPLKINMRILIIHIL